MSITVRVNGNPFDLFKKVSGSSSIDNFTSEAQITVTEQVNNQSFIISGDLVQISLDGFPKITGWAEKATDSEDTGSHDVSFRVRDKTADIIDSTVPDNVKVLKGIKKFSQLCELVVTGLKLDMKVIDEVGATFSDDLKAAKVGQNAFEFLQEYARKVQVFLTTDGEGNILITRPKLTLKTWLVNIPGSPQTNILKSTFLLDDSKRYNKYTVRSNNNVTAKRKIKGNLNNKGVAFDTEIRESRIYEKIAESPMTSAQCKKAAEEEANIRRARAFSYDCSTAGFSANGELWDDGKFVNVKDEKKQVIGKFLIQSTSFTTGGEIMSFKLTVPDAYTVVASPTAQTKAIAKPATTYTKKETGTQPQKAKQILSPNKSSQANPDNKNFDWNKKMDFFRKNFTFDGS